MLWHLPLPEQREQLGGNSCVALAGNGFAALGGNSVVALAGDGLLPSPRHVTGANAAATAAVSTSARTTVARIIAMPPTWNLSGLNACSRWLS